MNYVNLFVPFQKYTHLEQVTDDTRESYSPLTVVFPNNRSFLLITMSVNFNYVSAQQKHAPMISQRWTARKFLLSASSTLSTLTVL